MNEITEFITKGLGNITPYGSTHIDNERIKNINSYGSLCEDLIYELLKTARQIDRPEYSIQQMAKKAKTCLIDLKEMLDEI